MAWQKIDDQARMLEVDLHGYTVADAVDLACSKVSEAWQNGFERITLIHGAPGSTHHFSAAHTGYGGIKWQLRGILARGEWNEYLYGRRSKKHFVEEGFMNLRLRPNPGARAVQEWAPLPEPYYR